MQAADVIRTFIESIGQRAEAEFWLALFRAEAKERFATLVIEAPVLEHAFDAVVLDLRFLAAVGLTPVVTVGLCDPREAAAHAAQLQRGLAYAAIPAVVVPYGEAPEASAGGSDVTAVVQATHASCIPIIAFGEAAGGDVDARFACLGRLVSQLQARKLIFLSRTGALISRGAPAPFVNLTTEFELFAASPELSPAQQTLVRQSRRLVMELVAHKLLISVTSPLDLLRELFTVKGAGTLLRRGAVIDTKQGFPEVDQPRLHDLLTKSFGRAPKSSFYQRSVSRIYLEEGYRGAAITIDTPLGCYLSKFAVDRQAQGEGMGRDLWARLIAENRVVYWRARASNPINAWYMKECDGFVRAAPWLVFWKGLDHAQIPAAVAYALAQPEDMSPPAAPPSLLELEMEM